MPSLSTKIATGTEVGASFRRLVRLRLRDENDFRHLLWFWHRGGHGLRIGVCGGLWLVVRGGCGMRLDGKRGSTLNEYQFNKIHIFPLRTINSQGNKLFNVGNKENRNRTQENKVIQTKIP